MSASARHPGWATAFPDFASAHPGYGQVSPTAGRLTVLTLIVVPALYAMWFKVRLDEPAGASIAEPDPTAEPEGEIVPLRRAG